MPRLELKKIASLLGSLKFIRDKAFEGINNGMTKAIDFIDTPYFVAPVSLLSLADIFFFKGSPRYVADELGNVKEYYIKKYSYSEIGFLGAAVALSCAAPFVDFLSKDNYQNYIIATSALGAAEIIIDSVGLSSYWTEETYTRYNEEDNVVETFTASYSA